MNEDIQNYSFEIPEKDYVKIDKEGIVIGFLNNKIHSNIPDNVIEITKDTKKYLLNLGYRVKLKDKNAKITPDNIEPIEEENIDIPINPIDQLRADVDFLMIMEGYADV